jgi:hypothetical protein
VTIVIFSVKALSRPIQGKRYRVGKRREKLKNIKNAKIVERWADYD